MHMKNQSLVFSGVQPTGNLHLGNYLGAIKNWVKLQDKHRCIFCIVDLHAITVPQDPKHLRDATYQTLATYLACGIRPKDNILFAQSSVPGHSELQWILSCHTPLGWLNRMTQFKEKAGKHRENAVLGLYSYPVLMAADILLYKATHVPVGEDQKQHLELARDIAGAFNRAYQQEYLFPLPEPLILGEATRVMNLRDGTKKMSKSDESDYTRINLTDDADAVAQKFKKAKSDATMGFEVLEGRPEAINLLTIYASFAETSMKEAQEKFMQSGFGALKNALAELAVEKLSPITSEVTRLMKDKAYLDTLLKDGAERANEIAEGTLREVKELIGFVAA
jgi:tryptophanyl-tRNA synthetase